MPGYKLLIMIPVLIESGQFTHLQSHSAFRKVASASSPLAVDFNEGWAFPRLWPSVMCLKMQIEFLDLQVNVIFLVDSRPRL